MMKATLLPLKPLKSALTSLQSGSRYHTYIALSYLSQLFFWSELLSQKYRWSEGRKCLRTQWRSFRPLSNFVGNWEQWLMQEPLQMSSLIQPGTVIGISKHFEAFFAFKVWKSVSNTFTNCSYLNSSNSFLLINTPYFYWFEQVQSYSCWTKNFRAWVK